MIVLSVVVARSQARFGLGSSIHGCRHTNGTRHRYLIVNVFLAGLGSSPAALTPRTSNVYLPAFSLL
jgi:hypothetical protein